MSDEASITTSDSDDSTADAAIRAFVEEDDAPEEKSPKKAEPADDDEPEEERERKEKPERRERKDPEPEERNRSRKLDAEPEKDNEDEKEKKSEKPKRTYKHKVNGAEVEFDADEIDTFAKRLGVEPRALLSGSSLHRAAYDRMKEASELRKQAQGLFEALKRDPLDAARRVGVSDEEIRKLIEKRALEMYSSEFDPGTGQPLSEEQKRVRGLEAELARRQEAEQRTAAEQKRAEEARETEATRQHWIKTIVTRLETDKLPKAMLPRVAGHLADLVGAGASNDPADYMDDAVQLALEDVEAEHAKAFDEMPWETLKAHHPKLVEKVRKGIVADYHARGARRVEEPVRLQPERRRETGQRVMTTQDVMRDFMAGR